MKTSTCQQCNTSFIPKPGTFGKFCSLSCSTSYRNKQLIIQKHTKYQLNPKLCLCCKQPLSFDKKKNKFCSKSCSAKITNLIDRKRGPTKSIKPQYSSVKFLFCTYANKWYVNRNLDGTLRRSSPYVKTEKQKYYHAARFKFNVYHYPDEFNLSLIETYGWYTCPGLKRKNFPKNINGVSRDHIISVSYGFANNIDPEIIAHPANCRLMLHSNNYRKGSKCELTIPELFDRIHRWNLKYSERPIGLEPTTPDLEGQCSTN